MIHFFLCWKRIFVWLAKSYQAFLDISGSWICFPQPPAKLIKRPGCFSSQSWKNIAPECSFCSSLRGKLCSACLALRVVKSCGQSPSTWGPPGPIQTPAYLTAPDTHPLSPCTGDFCECRSWLLGLPVIVHFHSVYWREPKIAGYTWMKAHDITLPELLMKWNYCRPVFKVNLTIS